MALLVPTPQPADAQSLQGHSAFGATRPILKIDLGFRRLLIRLIANVRVQRRRPWADGPASAATRVRSSHGVLNRNAF